MQGMKTPVPPIPGPQDTTFEMLRLYEISHVLDDDSAHSASTLEASIAQVASYNFDFDGLILSQSILSFRLYRRLRLNSSSPSKTTDNIINVGSRGLSASRLMASRRQPWWHVANVPFQFVRILLEMDMQESLAKVGEAMRTLREVAECFPTQATRIASELLGGF